MTYNIMFVIALVVTFVLTVLILKKLIPVLKSHKMGQKILEIGPRWHKGKEGTPTMGGIAFIFAIAIVGLGGCIFLGVTDGIRSTLPLVLTLALGIAGGLIGCIDDMAKLRKKQNEGLTAPQKFILQVVAAVVSSVLPPFFRVLNPSVQSTLMKRLYALQGRTLNGTVVTVPIQKCSAVT